MLAGTKKVHIKCVCLDQIYNFTISFTPLHTIVVLIKITHHIHDKITTGCIILIKHIKYTKQIPNEIGCQTLLNIVYVFTHP